MRFLILAISALFALSCNDNTNTKPQTESENEYKVIVVENAGKVVSAGSCSTVTFIYKQNGKREKMALPKECEQQGIKVEWCNRPSKQKDCFEASLLVGKGEWDNWPFDLYLHVWREYCWQKYGSGYFCDKKLPYKIGDRVTVGYLEDGTGKFVLERSIQIIPYIAPPPEAEAVP